MIRSGLYLATLLCFCSSIDLNDYSVIIIPMGDDTPLRSLARPKLKQHTRQQLLDRLDLELNDDIPETVDVDNFDYERAGRSLKDADDDDDDLLDVGDDKIVGGFEVDINTYPYHVAYGNNCGGAILSEYWVATAGHCSKKTFIKVGSKYLSRGKKHKVAKQYVHPKWTAKPKLHEYDYDFQLLKLAHPLRFSENIQPVKVAHMEDMVVGKYVTVTGWGNTEENGAYSDVLRAVRLPIVAKEKCQAVKFPYFQKTLTPRMFCAGFIEGTKDACQGDSGGPAVSGGRLLGTVSFGYGCATPGSYGVYSKIALVRDWIEDTTGLVLD
ncbi:hypothetical protein JYU34_020089 [Plutella xylostella]|uniref:Peptidase S1 domain-containing protein n=1 Tax=Plutella xylostella TaxID=51655 RepID=A0ABQ7PVX4_PLUXY|nr:hypothetical protein JYU34_020089 [Plutella xylostella]